MVERKPEEQSTSILGGWQPAEGQDGMYTTAKQPESFTTKEFQEFSESMRARWNLGEYLKVKLQQMLKNRKSVKQVIEDAGESFTPDEY